MKEDTSATLARIFVEDDHYKVLKRLEPLRSGAELTGDASRKQLALLDVETIGFDPKHDVIIELALMCVELDEKNQVVTFDAPRSWLRDPARELPERIE